MKSVRIIKQIAVAGTLLSLLAAGALFAAEGELKYKNIFIRWKQVPGAVGYQVEVKNTVTQEVQTTDTAVNEVNLRVSEGDYQLRIGAMNNRKRVESWSSWKDFKVVIKNPPKAPQSLSAWKSVGDGGMLNIKLAWEAPQGEGKLRYAVVLVRGSKQERIGETDTTDYLVTDLPRGRGYSFIVFAVNEDGEESEQGVHVAVSDRASVMAFGIRASYIAPILKFGDLFDNGAGFTVDYSLGNVFTRGLSFGIETGFYYLHGRSEDSAAHDRTGASFIVPLCLRIGYEIRLYRSLFLVPAVSGGYTFNNLEYYRNGSREVKRFWEPLCRGGVSFLYKINELVAVRLGSEYGAVIESQGALSFMTLDAGVTFTFDLARGPAPAKQL